MKIVAIIPARGGSERIPNKNLISFNGKPLISHSIRDALASSKIDRVIVSSDSDSIGAVAVEYGAEFFKRPYAISQRNSSSEDALMHVIKMLDLELYDADIVVFLQCTSPNRKVDDIDNAITTFLAGDYDSLISVQETYALFWRKRNNKYAPLNYDPNNRLPEQKRAPDYIENGSIFIFKVNGFRENKNRIFGKVGTYTMSEFCSWQIDREEDIMICHEFSKYLTK